MQKQKRPFFFKIKFLSGQVLASTHLYITIALTTLENHLTDYFLTDLNESEIVSLSFEAL